MCIYYFKLAVTSDSSSREAREFEARQLSNVYRPPAAGPGSATSVVDGVAERVEDGYSLSERERRVIDDLSKFKLRSNRSNIDKHTARF